MTKVYIILQYKKGGSEGNASIEPRLSFLNLFTFDIINLFILQLRALPIRFHIATFRLLGQEFRLELVLKQHKKVHPKLICNLLPVGTMKAL